MPDSATKPPTILVIDDDAEIRYSLTRVLSSRKFHVIEAASGEQGVALMKKGPAPDLVFLDIRMGGMSGMEFIHECKRVHPGQKTMLVSGTVDQQIYANETALPDGFLAKPYQVADFIAAVQKLAGA